VLRRAFVPTLFAFHDQQPLDIVGQGAFPGTRGPERWTLDEAAVRRDYDFVWTSDESRVPVDVPASFEEIFAGGGARLFRVRHDR
jgi:hypothetical protein